MIRLFLSMALAGFLSSCSSHFVLNHSIEMENGFTQLSDDCVQAVLKEKIPSGEYRLRKLTDKENGFREAVVLGVSWHHDSWPYEGWVAKESCLDGTRHLVIGARTLAPVPGNASKRDNSTNIYLTQLVSDLQSGLDAKCKVNTRQNRKTEDFLLVKSKCGHSYTS